nr:MogA/MoaB family molybdenum cofactor biosynthesis protein [Desulfobacterales bacterium]
MSSIEHKRKLRRAVTIGIVTVSSSRSLEEDKSGNWIKKMSEKEGHRVVLHKIVPDQKDAIYNIVKRALELQKLDALIITGGTGISQSDVTIEAIKPMFTKELTAFGPIFAQLSYEKIEASAILSRATAGIVEKTIVFCLPGSIDACKLACTVLIFPEISHIVGHVLGKA